MRIRGSTALVTGANRGLGRAFVEALRTAGCARIYAAARSTGAVAPGGGIEPVVLDITVPAQVEAAAARCADVNLLINNAGVARFTPAIGAPTIDNARLEMETNYLGTLAMCRAFAPVLKRNGGGALVNMLSVVSFFNAPAQGSYCASKAAEWSLTKAVRFELRAQGTLVIGVYAGYIDTDMTEGLKDTPKSSPAAIAACVIEGIEAGTEDILADERSRDVFATLRKDDRAFDANLQTLWDQAAKSPIRRSHRSHRATTLPNGGAGRDAKHGGRPRDQGRPGRRRRCVDNCGMPRGRPLRRGVRRNRESHASRLGGARAERRERRSRRGDCPRRHRGRLSRRRRVGTGARMPLQHAGDDGVCE